MNYSLCTREQLPELQQFINDHWAKGHILSWHKELMQFQHGTDTGYNFVMARENAELCGILGFIPVNRYDPDDNGIWLAIWKSLVNGAGLGMLKYVDLMYDPDYICAIGINAEVEKLYLAMGYETGKMDHYLYEGKFDGSIAEIFPVRSYPYLLNRYIHNPFRAYKIIVKNNLCYVFRIIETGATRFARIFDIFRIPRYADVDYKFTVDYIDCLVSGIPKDLLLQADFTLKPETMISPIYLEPVVMENKEIRWAYKSEKPLVLFKGFSDMDRPNILPK